MIFSDNVNTQFGVRDLLMIPIKPLGKFWYIYVLIFIYLIALYYFFFVYFGTCMAKRTKPIEKTVERAILTISDLVAVGKLEYLYNREVVNT